MKLAWLAALVGISVVLVVWLCIWAVLRRSRAYGLANDQNDVRSAADSVVAAVGLILAVSSISFLALQAFGGKMQVFAAFGQVKEVVLPLTGLVLAVYALRIQSVLRRRFLPVWLWFLPLAVCASAVLSIAFPRQASGIYPVAEGIVLPGLFVTAGIVGTKAVGWSVRSESRLFVYLGSAGLLCSLTESSLGIFTALPIPAAFALCYLGVRNQYGLRWSYLLVAALIGLSTTFYIATSSSADVPSSATVTEIGVCSVFFVVLVFVPRLWRLPVIGVCAIGGLLGALKSGYIGLLLGNDSFIDVTLSQRGYEANGVIQVVNSSPLSLLFGLGPGATLDLSASPDRSTLASAGRNLLAVEDVHLLPSHLLLKFGLMGLAFLTLLVLSIGRLTVRVLMSERPDHFSSSLMFFVVSAFVVSLPAATNLFTNLLMPMLLGAVIARDRTGQVSEPPSSIPASLARTSNWPRRGTVGDTDDYMADAT